MLSNGVDTRADLRPRESVLVVEIQEADRVSLDLERVEAASRTDPDHAAKPRRWCRHETDGELRVREGLVADELHAHDFHVASVAGDVLRRHGGRSGQRQSSDDEAECEQRSAMTHQSDAPLVRRFAGAAAGSLPGSSGVRWSSRYAT